MKYLIGFLFVTLVIVIGMNAYQDAKTKRYNQRLKQLAEQRHNQSIQSEVNQNED